MAYAEVTRPIVPITYQSQQLAKLMHSWGFALREGLFAKTKEGKCKNKREKS